MTYLLDVNALVALGFLHHEFHARVATWIQASHSPQLASCSITELGFDENIPGSYLIPKEQDRPSLSVRQSG
jgi:hypothetical protein